MSGKTTTDAQGCWDWLDGLVLEHWSRGKRWNNSVPTPTWLIVVYQTADFWPAVSRLRPVSSNCSFSWFFLSCRNRFRAFTRVARYACDRRLRTASSRRQTEQTSITLRIGIARASILYNNEHPSQLRNSRSYFQVYRVYSRPYSSNSVTWICWTSSWTLSRRLKMCIRCGSADIGVASKTFSNGVVETLHTAKCRE